MIIFRRCSMCRRLLLIGHFRYLYPRQPPVQCGDCRRAEINLWLVRLVECINGILLCES